MPNHKEIARLYLMGMRRNEINRRVKSSKDSVSKVIGVLKEKGYVPKGDKLLSDDEISKLLGMPTAVKSVSDSIYEMPDYEALVKMLHNLGVTMKLLFDEYCYDW